MDPQTAVHLREAILDTFCAACNRERSTLPLDKSVQELGLDSLSLVAVFSQTQFVCGIELNGDQTFQLLNAVTVADVVDLLVEFAGQRDDIGRP